MSQLLSTRIFLAKIKLKIGKEKTNQVKYKIKYLNGEKKVGRFYEKELLLYNL